MRKAILFSVFVAGSGYLFAGNNPFKTREARNSTFYVPHSDVTDCAIHIESLTSDTLFLGYERLSMSLPTGWVANLCDNANCYGDVREAGNMAPFKAPAEAFIKITVAPQGLAGTAVIQYAVWNLKAPTQRDTLTLNIVVNWGAGVQEQVANAARVYPNPATGFVQVFNPAQEPVQAVLRTIDGKQLGQAVTVAPSQEMKFPMQHLPSGVYLVALHSETYNTVIRVVHP
jgi:hypothetical protein